MFDFQNQENEDLLENRKDLLDRLVFKYGEAMDLEIPLNLGLKGKFENYFVTVQNLKEFYGFNFLLNLWVNDNQDRGESGSRFKILVQLLNMDTHQRIIVDFPITGDETVPSLTPLWDGSFWCEQEAWDMFGIDFEDIPRERLLSPDGMEGYSLRKDFSPKPFQLKASSLYEFSPDPRVSREEWKKRDVISKDLFFGKGNGPVRAVLECYDESVKRGRLEVGYLHRGIEKIAEGQNLIQFLPHLNRINMNCSSFYEQIWCQGIEEYLDIFVPERAKALRMVFNEMERIFEHLDMLGGLMESLDCHQFLVESLEIKEAITGVFKIYSGRRSSHQLIKIGGITKDVPKSWITECIKLMTFIEKRVHELSKMISNSTLWMDRLCGYRLNSGNALGWGVSGPNLRASGVNYDLRKVSPHYFYNDIEFEVPMGINGECYDRYLVRIEEIFQSISIINQLLDNLPLGTVRSKDPRVVIPNKEDVFTDSEALIQHHKLFAEGITIPEGGYYSSIESPNGELGCHLTSIGGTRPYRMKLRTPSFFSGQCFTDIIEGGSIEELPMLLSSLNIVVGEIDR